MTIMCYRAETEIKGTPENFGLGLTGKEFEKICGIPHGSGKEGQLGDYIEKKSQENNYEFTKDDAGNILVIIPGDPNKDSTILQTHMDMVKEPDTMILIIPEITEINGEFWIRSKDEQTTLGADNGIMLAFQLGLMEELKNKKHGNIALLFTTQEETGMGGVQELGEEIKNKLSNYKNFINLDNETDHELIISSAGIGILTVHLDSQKEIIPDTKKLYEVSISGLPGGHSGAEIHKNIPNAIKLIGDKLHILKENDIDFNLVLWDGVNQAMNKISNNSRAIIAVDKNLTLEYPEIKLDTNTMFNQQFTYNSIDLVNQLQYGVLAKNDDLSPKLSANPGIIETTDDGVQIKISIRSSSDSLIEDTITEINNNAKSKGFSTTQEPLISGWEADTNNKLIEDFKKNNFILKSTHGGLECGFFHGYFPNADIISIGPTIENPHTSRERVKIKSVKYLHDMLLNMLLS